MRKALSLVAGLAGLYLFGHGAYMGAKAELSQVLLERAWAKIETTQATTAVPWPWLDAQVIGRISVPRLEKSSIVLDTDSGQALAFGPTLIAQTARPGSQGTIGIAAHKNTHFSFIKDLKIGDKISLQHSAGTQDYIIRTAAIIDSREAGLSVDTNARELALVTCYPFDSLSFNGPLRYIVYAEAVEGSDANITRI